MVSWLQRLAFGASLAALSPSPRALADGLRIALVGAPDNVHEATATALAPWDIVVIALPADPALGNGDAAIERARELASEHRAGAVVWLPAAPAGSNRRALWLYDVRADRITTRPTASSPPFTEPAAAAVALSLKTLLRNSRLIPEDEVEVEVEVAEPPPPPAPPAAPPDRALSVEVELALRVGFSALAPDPEPRLTVAAVWWPPRLYPRYGVALELDVGPGVSVTQEAFNGELADLAVGLSARRRLALGRRVSASASLVGSAHFTRVQGELPADARAVTLRRINPHLAGRLALESRLPTGLRLYVHAAGVWSLDRQRYLVDGELVLELPRLSIQAGVGAGYTW